MQRLRGDDRIATAAFVAGTFRMDPIEVLNADYFDWRVRLVCAERYWEERNKAEAKAAATGK